MNAEARIVQQIEDSINLKRYLQGEAKTLVTIADVLTEAFQNGNKVLLFGNGGSAADAQHIACELAGKFYRVRDPLPAIALTTNTSSLTAIANDFDYTEVFARQLHGLVNEGDIAIGISTSGRSPNVIRGIEEAKSCGAIAIALTGDKGELAQLADYVLSIPSKDTPRIQEAHITAGHIICYLIEEALFANEKLNRAVFIDRDGTINKDVPYCSCPEDFQLLPLVAEGIRLLNQQGIKVVVVTNQSGISRGYFTEEMLTQIHRKMQLELAEGGASVDAIYYCPHHPDSHCNCRKPQPTMLLRAARELDLDLSHSYVVGDSDMDIQMGKTAGCKTIWVTQSVEVQNRRNQIPNPDYAVPTLCDAAKWIVEQLKCEPSMAMVSR